MFRNSGFRRTLCGGRWESLSDVFSVPFGTGYSYARSGCCSPGTFMAHPNNAPFAQVGSCESCPVGKTTYVENDETACQNYVCSITNGSVANNDTYPCKCGTSDCDYSSGFYCLSSSSTCSAGNPCESDNGSLENADDCKCGNTICYEPDKMFCLSSINFCGSTCPAGKYRDATTADNLCAVCASGQYRALETDPPHTCVPCAAGKYNGNDDTHADQHLVCEDCTDGLSSRAGAAVCTNMLPECQFDNDNSTIDPVPKCTCGISTECTEITGLLCHAADSTCKCPAGQYKDTSDPPACQKCTAGMFLALVGQDGVASCQPCEAGKYADVTGAIACGTCAIGKEYVGAAADCRTCDGGKFQNSSTEVSASCSPCSPGFYNADQGKTRIAQKHEFCDVCPDGLISGEGKTFCIGCPIGWSTTSAANRSKPCEECPPGTKGEQEGETSTKCESCAPGQYQDLELQAFCVSIFDPFRCIVPYLYCFIFFTPAKHSTDDQKTPTSLLTWSLFRSLHRFLAPPDNSLLTRVRSTAQAVWRDFTRTMRRRRSAKIAWTGNIKKTPEELPASLVCQENLGRMTTWTARTVQSARRRRILVVPRSVTNVFRVDTRIRSKKRRARTVYQDDPTTSLAAIPTASCVVWVSIVRAVR